MDQSFTVQFLDESIEEAKTMYKCSFCDYESEYRHNLSRHVVALHRPTVTPAISVESTTTVEKGRICEYCGKVFKTKYGIDMHTKDKHTKEFRFKCEVCGKGYNRLWNFRGHVKMHHKELRDKCACGKEFQYRSSFILHQKKCSAEHDSKTFQCTECGLIFDKNKTLREHIQGVHAGRIYKCEACGKTFKWRSSLSYHAKTFQH